MFSRGYKSLISKRKKFSNDFKDLAERCKCEEAVCKELEESIYSVEQSPNILYSAEVPLTSVV
jgi:hypothetical protein